MKLQNVLGACCVAFLFCGVSRSAVPVLGDSPPPVPSCVQWSVSDGGNGHCYEIVDNGLPWRDARDRAPMLSVPSGFGPGHLATISSAAEDQFLRETFSHPAGAFFGFTDEVIEGEWRWIDDTPGVWQDPNFFANPIQTAFTFWGTAPDEPNNYLGNEDYAQVVWSDYPAGVWNDATDVGGVFLLEWEPLPIPEPGTLSLAALFIGYIGVKTACRLVLGKRRRTRILVAQNNR